MTNRERLAPRADRRFRAGMDVVSLGGIDKHEIAKGGDALAREVDRVVPPMKRRGGYCVALDHWVPPTISLADYRGFVEAVRNARTG